MGAFRRGSVRVGSRKAGTVRETGSGYAFTYDREYLSLPGVPPVSLTLPLRPEPYESKTLFPFFDGLIPEGWLLALARKTWKLDPRDRMGLLPACCADCIGDCFLTGNADMHLKNFSLWRPPPGNVQLAPAYDLVATRLVLPQDPEESALALNGKKENLRRKDFDALAGSLALMEKVRDNVYAKLSATPRHWESVREKTFLGREHRKELTMTIAERSKRLGLG